MYLRQTKFFNGEPGSGNCTEAAVASILGIPLEEVPTFYDGTPGSQELNMEEFFNARGLQMCMQRPDCYYADVVLLAAGPAARGCSHMVLMRNGELEHDPHPSDAGLLSVDCYYVLIPQRMSEFVRK
jgi:hypothetical protein